MKKFLCSVLALLLCVHLSAQTVNILDYGITFNGVEKNLEQNISEWSYTVSTERAAKDLSHWVLELCSTHHVLTSNYPYFIPTNGDPATGVYGIKWDNGILTGRKVTFTFILKGIYQVGDVKAAIRTGGRQKVAVAYIKGPSCRCEDKHPGNSGKKDKKNQ